MSDKGTLESWGAWRQTRWQEARSAWWALLVIAALAFFAGLRIAPKEFIEYLRVLLAWPPIVGVIALLFLHRFREPIGRWLERFQYRTRSGDVIGPAQAEAPAHVPDTTTIMTTTPAPEDQVYCQDTNAEVKRWKFLYYSVFYVLQTKGVLMYLGGVAQQAIPLLATIFPLLGEGPGSQLAVILGVLREGGMVEVEGPFVKITETGREFLRFCGLPDKGAPFPTVGATNG